VENVPQLSYLYEQLSAGRNSSCDSQPLYPYVSKDSAETYHLDPELVYNGDVHDQRLGEPPLTR